MLRSMLFVPGNAPDKMAKACESGADAVIFDLEDSVALEQKIAARASTTDFLRSAGKTSQPELWVRVNPVTSGLLLDDLAWVLRGQPAGIVVPKVNSAEDIKTIDHYLSALEVVHELPRGQVKVLPIATETPQSLFHLGSYAGSSPRLAGMTWGAEDLPAALGATANRRPDGGYSDVCRLARTLCLAGAATAGVPALETVYPAFRDSEGLAAYAAEGKREGFTGMLALHPLQIPIIHEAFTPAADEIAFAKRIVESFANAGGAGVVSLDGRMLDAPHLALARNLLARTAQPAGL